MSDLSSRLQALYDQVPSTRCANSGECCVLTGEEFDNDYATMFPLYSAEYRNIVEFVKSNFSEERRRQLFVLGGHRLHDMLRFDIPFLGEPGSIHPNGLDQTGAEYGNLTCFQLPEVEVKGNENISS